MRSHVINDVYKRIGKLWLPVTFPANVVIPVVSSGYLMVTSGYLNRHENIKNLTKKGEKEMKLQITTSEWNNAIKKVEKTVSKDSLRPSFCNIHMRLEGGYLELASVDGYCGSMVRVGKPKVEDGEDFFIELPEVVKFKGKDRLLIVEIDLPTSGEDGEVVFTDGASSTVLRLSGYAEGGKNIFNTLEEVASKNTDGRSLLLNPALLRKTLMGLDGENVRITVGEPHEPVVIEGADCRKIVLPLRE